MKQGAKWGKMDAKKGHKLLGQKMVSLKYHHQTEIYQKTASSWTTKKWNRQIPWFQRVRKPHLPRF